MKEESDLRQKVHDEIQYVEWSCEQRGIEGKDRTVQDSTGSVWNYFNLMIQIHKISSLLR